MEMKRPTYRLFYLHHGLVPAVALALLLWLVARWELDSALATAIYDGQGQSWGLKNNYWLETIIHKGGRLFFGIGYLGLLGCCLLPNYKAHRGPLIYLALSLFIAIVSISLLKKISGIHCPWSVNAFGGSRDIIHWFQGFNGESGCFPAGHASSGYAWVALYFFALMLRPTLKYSALAFGLSLGLIYGGAQQLRGAHFVSHDIWTLAICWFIPMLIYPRFSSKLAAAINNPKTVNQT